MEKSVFRIRNVLIQILIYLPREVLDPDSVPYPFIFFGGFQDASRSKLFCLLILNRNPKEYSHLDEKLLKSRKTLLMFLFVDERIKIINDPDP
jgi:hypothetical protein